MTIEDKQRHFFKSGVLAFDGVYPENYFLERFDMTYIYFCILYFVTLFNFLFCYLIVVFTGTYPVIII